MTVKRGTRFARAPLIAALAFLVMPLLNAGRAGAMYLADGSRQTGPGTYENPNDGFCVIGIKPNGDMLVDKNITNFRDCVGYPLGGAPFNLTTQANCAPAAVGANLPVSSTGWRHQWSTSVCQSGGVAISRVDLDNTAAMCTAKGGTIGSACIAFGWFYRGVKSDGTVISITGSPDGAPPFNTSNFAVWQGATSSDGLGFCYREMDFTNAVSPAYTRPANYPAISGTNECPMFYPLNPSGRVRTGTSWSDYVFNWDFNNIGPPGVPPPIPVPTTGGTKCRYAYGVRGILTSAITATVAAVGAAPAFNATTKYDLTTSAFDTQGKCLANGLSWENWVPTTGFVDATVRGVFPSPLSTTACGGATDCYAAVDLTTLAKDGGAKFTSRQCLRCHSDQSRGPAERDKPGFVKHRHKLSGDSTDPVVAGIGTPWGEKGVVCAVCHAGANPHVSDFIQKDATGTPKTTSAHEVSQYGAAVTQLCYTCHSDASAPNAIDGNATPAAFIPVTAGDFTKNAQRNAPIVNQFLNSPHAQYSGTSSAADIQDKTKYGSSFLGYICRANNAIGSGDILTTVFQNGSPELIHSPDSLANPNCTNAPTGTPSGAAGFWVAEGSAASNSQGNCMTCHDPHWSIHDPNPEAEPFRRECTTCHDNPGTSASGAPQIDLVTINHLKTAGTPLEHWTTAPDEACEICHMPLSSASGSPMHLWRINTDPSYVTMGASQANTAADGSYTDAAWVDVDHACGQCHYAVNGAPGNGAPIRSKVQLAAAAVGMHAASAVTYQTTFTTQITGLKVDVTAQVNCGVGISCPPFTYDWYWGDSPTHGSGSPATHTYTSYSMKTIVLTVLDSDGRVAGSATRNVTPVSPNVTFTAVTTGLSVNVTASASCPPAVCPSDFTYSWSWGDGTTTTTNDPTKTASHTYAAGGTKTVTLTVSETGKILATAARNVYPTAAVADNPPTASGTCTWSANTWTASVTDTSTDTDPTGVQTVTVTWGDGTRSVGGKGSTVTHTYSLPPTAPATSYAVVLTAIDSALKASTPVTLTCTNGPVAPAYFSISGTVTASNPLTKLAAAAVTVKKGTTAIKMVYTGSTGVFTAGNLKPGTYTLTVTKPGYTFASPAATRTIGPSSSGNTISATAP